MDTLISSPSAAYRALEGFDPAHIGLIFDPGNMVNEGFEDYQKSFELLGDYIAHIHIKNGILAPGRRGRAGRLQMEARLDAAEKRHGGPEKAVRSGAQGGL